MRSLPGSRVTGCLSSVDSACNANGSGRRLRSCRSGHWRLQLRKPRAHRPGEERTQIYEKASDHDQEQFTSGDDVLCGRVEGLVRRTGQACRGEQGRRDRENGRLVQTGPFRLEYVLSHRLLAQRHCLLGRSPGHGRLSRRESHRPGTRLDEARQLVHPGRRKHLVPQRVTWSDVPRGSTRSASGSRKSG